MAIDHKNYNPDLMAGAGETIQGSLTVNGSITSGAQIITGAVSHTGSYSATGTSTVLSGTAVPASAGAVAAGKPITMFSSGPSIYVTSDTPTFSAVKGSLCINTAGSGVGDRLYVNNGTTNWVAVTTAS